MKRIKILIAIIILTITVIFVTPVIVAPLLNRKLTEALNEKYTNYTIVIDKVNWSLISSKLELKKITIVSKTNHLGAHYIYGEISSIQLNGINLIKAVFKNKYEIDEVHISNISLEGKVQLKDIEKQSTVSSINIQIGHVLFDQINLSLKDSSSSQSFSLKEGVLKIANLEINKLDTLGIPIHINFKAEQLLAVSADSMYTYKTCGIAYSDTIKTLTIDSLYIEPNYKEYDFTAKYPYEIDRIGAVLSQIRLDHFPVVDYFNSGNIVSSYIVIGNMDLNVFRDKRKEDSPLKKPAFQEIIYNYPGLLRIDSIGFNGGSFTYTEHAEKANEPGKISMNELKVRIYNLTNDTIYKTIDTLMQLRIEALLMGKSKMTFSLKAKLFDSLNTFSVNGSLAELEVKDLNPILEKNAFMYANSAKIDKMNFNFTANDTKATGKMIMLYHGLDVAIKNKRTDEIKALKERIISLIVNKKTWDSNPTPGDKVRVGIIDYERDPTKFIFNYCIKSIASGIKSSVMKSPKKKKTFLQKIFGSGDKKHKEAIKE